MRTIKELLQLTVKEGNLDFKKGNIIYPYGFTGLCGFINNHLHRHGIITPYEYQALDNFISTNRPQKNSPHYRSTMEFHAYYWKTHAWIPRKKWLIDQIKSL